jgi:short-subunit dehydrogenase
MGTKLEGKVVVITGASSGIGRAAALTFARHGAKVVLAARGADPLAEVAAEIERAGGEALAVPTDVTDTLAVEALANAAVERFGRIDVWINNAAVGSFGTFEETPADVHEQVIRTNLFGYLNGARVALREFRRNGAGVLVNNASLLGKVAPPFLSAYSISKFGVVAFGESLRQELIDVPDIRVSTVMPAAIDTPFYAHAANFTSRRPKPINPTYHPQAVADALARAAVDAPRELVVGSPGILLVALRRLSPRLFEQGYARQVRIDHFTDEPALPTTGNVHAPLPDAAAIEGGWPHLPHSRLGALPAAAGLAGAGVVAALWLRTRGAGRRP